MAKSYGVGGWPVRLYWDWGYSLFLFPFPIPCVRGLKNKYFIEFLEAALVKYLMNDFNRMIICHFELKISELKISSDIFKF